MLSRVPLNVTYGPYLSCNEVRHAPGTKGDHEMTCILEANPPKKSTQVRWRQINGKVVDNDDNFMVNTTEDQLKVRTCDNLIVHIQ